MGSSAPRKRGYLLPPEPPVPISVYSRPEEEIRGEKRIGTVYDAVAGRISHAGFISALPFISSTRDTASSSALPATPETVLFRRKRAPERYEESDYYFANELLPPGHLPESDLLKALHCYTSDFYSRAAPEDSKHDWRSMDETALLALGVLMEEISKEALGETGDMVFTEGEIDAENSAIPRTASGSERSTCVVSRARRERKRRRLDALSAVDDSG